jgi:CBS domain-containing protein
MKVVREVMTDQVVSVPPAMPIKDVARILVDRRISGLPVVAEDGSVIGVVTEGDLLVKEHDLSSVHRRPLARIFGESREMRQLRAKAEALTAGEAMSSPAITIRPDSPIHEAASVMIERKVNRLPVVDEHGKLLGIVARADVVRTLVRADAELAEDVRHEALWKGLWIDPATFHVEVTNGIAKVQGSVQRRSTAAIVERMVRSVPGIVDVVAEIEWSIDDHNHDVLPPETPSADVSLGDL